MEQLHEGAKWSFRIRTYFSLLFLMIFFASFFLPLVMSASETPSFDSFFKNLFFLFFGSVVISVLFGEIYSRLAYKNWKFELSANELKLERGIIWKKYSAIPYERVQNVDIHRGIVARILKFSSLNIQTAGYSAMQGRGTMSEGYIPAVSIKRAEEIREFLMKRISKKGI